MYETIINDSDLYKYASLIGGNPNQIKIEIMRTNLTQRQPCRYGANCKYLLTNNCHYYHPQSDFRPRPRQDYVNTAPNNPSQKTQRSFSRGRQYYDHNRTSRPQEQNYNRQGSKYEEDPSRMLCKNFHSGVCKYGDKCERLHQFLYKHPQGLRRLEHHRQIPQHPCSRLTKIECQGKELFALRQGNGVVLFEYSFENGQLATLGQPIALRNECEYYGQHEKRLYFSSQNPTTKYSDMGFHDIETQEAVWIANAHTAKITSILHWDQDTLLSSSVAGDIKFWSRTEEGFIFNKEMTEGLLQHYNPHKNPLEILFLEIFNFNDVRILSAGTNDSRLLFWSGNNFEFMEFHLGPRYTRIYKARLNQFEGTLTAAVLAWSIDSTASAVLMLNLQTSAINLISEVQAGQKFSKNLHLLECMQEYIFVGCMRGQVNIYNLRQSEKKVGAILHQNTVADVICSQVFMKSTGVKVKLVYVLEKRTRESEGSFSIYLLQ